jgi:hypothetical protein
LRKLPTLIQLFYKRIVVGLTITRRINALSSTNKLIRRHNPYFYGMKVYHFKHQEILLNEQALQDAQTLELYKDIVPGMMVRHELSKKKIFEGIDIIYHKISVNPLTVVTLLKKQELPPFVFLACRN